MQRASPCQFLPHSRFTASVQSFVIKDFALADEHHSLLDLATGSITPRPSGSKDEAPTPPSLERSELQAL
ncbi:hypothetical protein [Actinomyces mediterranea]|uniref:hypothetical protein n=1 Tax=Actinomyces mediterranea TaxID=1871028 RepID=UPI000970F286|nr:hypothetical protein [Actinomyces mediterranea]